MLTPDLFNISTPAVVSKSNIPNKICSDVTKFCFILCAFFFANAKACCALGVRLRSDIYDIYYNIILLKSMLELLF